MIVSEKFIRYICYKVYRKKLGYNFMKIYCRSHIKKIEVNLNGSFRRISDSSNLRRVFGSNSSMEVELYIRKRVRTGVCEERVEDRTEEQVWHKARPRGRHTRVPITKLSPN